MGASPNLEHRALQDVLDALPEGIAVFDPEDRLIYCTRKFQETYSSLSEPFPIGTTFAEIVRQSVEKGIVRLNGVRAEAFIARRVADHRTGHGVTEHQLYDGRWMRVTDIRTEDGLVISRQIDVSNEKQSELDLIESERRLLGFARSASDFFWEMDEELRFSYFSERFAEVTGVAAERLLGKRREESGIEDTVDDKLYRRHLDDLHSHRPFRNFIHPRTKSDGETVWLSISGLPVFDDLGTFKGYRGTGQDITESVMANEALKRERNFFTGAMESTTDGFALFDPDDRLVFCNSSFKNLNPDLARKIGPGMTFEEMLRDNVANGRILEAVGREDEFIQERMARHLNPSDEGMVSQRQDGRWLMLREQRMPDGSTFLVNTDLTMLKERERALEIEKERAERTDRAKSEFLANMSHELRTPLNAIIGFSELLSSPDAEAFMVGDRRVEYAGSIWEAGHHLLSLINDILDMSKIEAGEYRLGRALVDLRDLIRSVVNLMKPRADSGGVSIDVSLPNETTMVYLDERAVRQMLLNLLSNAVKFSHEGKAVHISGFFEQDVVQLTVSDKGTGMSEQALITATDPFVQGGIESFNEGGTGLGLAITKRLAELHGGRLEIQSRLGAGTIVRIDLPAGIPVEE